MPAQMMKTALSAESVMDRRSARYSRSTAIDMLRAMAILMVIGRHLVPHLERIESLPTFFRQILAGWYQVGWLGVDLFFVLSGYLIGGLLFSEWKRTGRIDVKAFLIRRGLKIYPAYYAFLLYGIAKLVWDNRFASRHEIGEVLATVCPSLFLIQNYFDHYFWGHTWSLAVEEHFYLCLSFVVSAMISRRWWSRMGYLAVVVILAAPIVRAIALYGFGVESGRVYTLTHFRIDGLLVGVILRYLLEFSKFRPKWTRFPWWLFAIIGLLPYSLAYTNSWNDYIVLSGGLSLFAVGGAFLVIAALCWDGQCSEMNGSFVVRMLRWIGINSYSTYLWHVTIMGISLKLLGKATHAVSMSATFETMVAVVVVITSVTSFGALASSIVEKPILRMRDRLYPSRAIPLDTCVRVS